MANHYIAFPVWSYSERFNVRDSTTGEVKKIADTHFTAIVIDKGLGQIIHFEPMAEEEGATETHLNERKRTWPKNVKKMLEKYFKEYEKYITFGTQGQAEDTCGTETINFITS